VAFVTNRNIHKLCNYCSGNEYGTYREACYR